MTVGGRVVGALEAIARRGHVGSVAERAAERWAPLALFEVMHADARACDMEDAQIDGDHKQEREVEGSHCAVQLIILVLTDETAEGDDGIVAVIAYSEERRTTAQEKA